MMTALMMKNDRYSPLKRSIGLTLPQGDPSTNRTHTRPFRMKKRAPFLSLPPCHWQALATSQGRMAEEVVLRFPNE